MHLQHKMCQFLIGTKVGVTIYTSQAYSQDRTRRALGVLTKHGYFKKTGRFSYKRTDKQ